MVETDKEFVEYVVRALVSNPDAVSVRRSIDDMGVLLELSVDPADMGKVIGKAGATAKSIRTLLRVLGAKNDARVNLKIVEPEGERQSAEADAAIEEEVQSEGAPEDLRAQTQKEIEELADLEL